MTPAIKLLEQKKIKHSIHQYEHDSSAESYGLEAVHKLGLDESRVYKTLVIALAGDELATAILPVALQLNLKLAAKSLGTKRAAMCDPARVERVTGYVLGGVSPLGQKKRLKTVIDESASSMDSIFVSAGRRGLEIELAPQDLINLLPAHFAAVTQ